MRLRLVTICVAAVAALVVAGAFAVTGSNTITTFAGTGEPGFSGDGGPATAAKIYRPSGLAVDAQGNVYIADLQNDRVRKVDTGGTITTIAGGGSIPGPGIGDGGPATSAELNVPEGVAVDGQGNVYIADRNNGRIRKVNAAGTITTLAGGGNPIPPDVGDGGPATSARLAFPDGVAVDGQGNVYIADRDHMRVRRVDTSGIITTLAGNGTQGGGGDGGMATSAQLRFPHGLAVDGQGNVYIADYQNHRVRKVDTAGIITSVAGNGVGCSAYFPCGDNGPATSAQVALPLGVALDGQGNLYIAQQGYRLRKVDTAGTISTISGHGTTLGDGGPAVLAYLLWPSAVAVDGQGNLYVADYVDSRVRKIAAFSQSTTTIDFAALADKTYGDPDFTVSATASSGLPVSFTASGNCTVNGPTVHITGAGSCTITASQPGDANYPPAPSVSRTFSIAKAGQTIMFAALANKRFGDPDFAVSASASSGLAVAFAASGNCTVTGTQVRLTAAGGCTITASQPGNANYNAAAAVARTFAIAPRTQTQPPPPRKCRVPRVVGKRLAAAKAAIKQRRCRTGKVTYAYSRPRKKGIVVAQSRRPGRVLPANAKINLIISRGRRR